MRRTSHTHTHAHLLCYEYNLCSLTHNLWCAERNVVGTAVQWHARLWRPIPPHPPAPPVIGRACVLHQPLVSVCLRLTRVIVAVFAPAADADGKISLFLCKNAQTDASRVHSCRPHGDKVRARCLGSECGREQMDVFVCACVCLQHPQIRALHTGCACALAAIVHLSTHSHTHALMIKMFASKCLSWIYILLIIYVSERIRVHAWVAALYAMLAMACRRSWTGWCCGIERLSA